MPYPQNPFKIRASEHMVSAPNGLDLRLFGPQILTHDQLKNRSILERLIFIRSSPGGGKTTLLRLFSPSTLLTLFRLRDFDEYKELWKIMKEIGAVNINGPSVVGVYLRFSPTYPSIEDLDIDNNRKNRFLFSLLNAKIILSGLKSLLEIKKLIFPDDLNRVVFKVSNETFPFYNDISPLSGDSLFKWAVEIENSICKGLDSITPELQVDVKGYDKIIFDLLNTSNIFIDGAPVNEKIVILFDDFNKLTRRQRETLIDFLTHERVTFGIWISERYQALDFATMINDISSSLSDEQSSWSLKSYISNLRDKEPELISGAKLGRDYENVIHLEKLWKKNPKSFEKNVMNIANRRLAIAKDLDLSHFEDLLEYSLDGTEYNKVYSRAIETISRRIRERIGNESKYTEWIKTIDDKDVTLREKANSWRNLEIIIEREIGKKQRTLTNVSLSQVELEERDDSSVRAIAEFYLANEFNLPFYFGPEILAQLAHFNIEQFLSIAGDIFDEIRGEYRIKARVSLTPRQQHEIIKRSADKKWDEIVNGIAYTRETKWLLEGMGKFLKKETFNPKASYLSVTGIGLKMNDLNQLKGSDHYKRLRDTLESCLANNLLEAREINQGGDKNTVFYLNRLLCVKFNLPLSYGGWRPKKLNDLQIWIEGKNR